MVLLFDEGKEVMRKTITLEIPVDLLGDIEVVKHNAANLEELMRKYPHTITGDVQRIYVKNNNVLLNKISKGLTLARKSRITK